jgi:SEFIR domain-containing protein/NB-ARC domain-containing protein
MFRVASRDPPAKGIGTMADAPRVFLSYSHDSDEHADRVLALANALCDLGIDVILDRYVYPAPEKDWPHWMDRNLDAAQFVLMVCTATYRRRVLGEEAPGQGTGVRWEGKLIYNRICYDKPAGSRFIPILLPGAEPTHIPDPVRGHNHYRLATFDLTDPGFEALYRHLTDQPATPRPGLGPIQILPPKPRPQAVPGPLPPSGGPWWNVPYPRNPNFTGRESILAQLEATLAAGTPAALAQAIAGLGGVGKTQTAVEYAYRHRDQYRAVLWIRADTETSLASGYRALAKVLGLSEKDETDSTKVVAAVRRWLGREPGYLLILDNADDPTLVKPYLPPNPRGHVLLTARAHNFDVLGIRRPIGLPVLTPGEALEFLVKRTGREGPLDPAEQDAARILAGELGYLPLALEQAAAYMVEHEEAFAVYLAAYRALRLSYLKLKGEDPAMRWLLKNGSLRQHDRPGRRTARRLPSRRQVIPMVEGFEDRLLLSGGNPAGIVLVQRK